MPLILINLRHPTLMWVLLTLSEPSGVPAVSVVEAVQACRKLLSRGSDLICLEPFRSPLGRRGLKTTRSWQAVREVKERARKPTETAIIINTEGYHSTCMATATVSARTPPDVKATENQTYWLSSTTSRDAISEVTNPSGEVIGSSALHHLIAYLTPNAPSDMCFYGT